MARSDIRITYDSLRPNLAVADAKAIAALDIAMSYWVARCVNYMRTHARWTDRTSAARNGLVATKTDDGDSASIHLYHSMPYGIWLEVRWSGRYAIIGPTMDVLAPQIHNFCAQAVLQALEV